MSDDPFDPQLFPALDDPAPGREPAQPVDAPVPQTPPAVSALEPSDEAYVAELRQSLHDQAPEPAKAEPHTEGLFRRITGSLRRRPGSTAQLAAGSPETRQPADEQPEIGDDFLAGRLGGGVFSPEPAPVPPEEPPPAAMAAGEVAHPFAHPAPPAGQPQAETAADEPLLDGDAPIVLLESGAIAALANAEEAAGEDVAPDWMAAVRQDPPSPGAPGGEAAGARGLTGQLRGFIAGILGNAEEKQNPPPGALSVPDEVVTDRLGRSLGVVPGEAPGGAQSEASWPERDGPAPGERAAEEPRFEGLTPAEEALFLENLEARFGSLGEGDGADQMPALGAAAETIALEPSWESAPTRPDAPPAFSPQDLWAPPAEGDEPPPPAGLAPSIAPSPAPLNLAPEDVFAAQFLGGQTFEPEPAPASPPPELLRLALAHPVAPVAFMPVSDMRALALEGYEETGAALPSPTAAGLETGAREASAARPGSDWQAWFAGRSRVEKILLFEAAAVALALLVAIPFFAYMILRGPAPQPGAGGPAPRPLPANVPYPTGLTLPGGWYFALGKSTFRGGAWKPAGSEWLEGTELRRVIALPWNPQTEAVFQTFEPGDRVSVSLNNADLLVYQIREVKRVPVSDVSILSDRSPSLVVLLYQEAASERWVILAKP